MLVWSLLRFPTYGSGKVGQVLMRFVLLQLIIMPALLILLIKIR